MNFKNIFDTYNWDEQKASIYSKTEKDVEQALASSKRTHCINTECNQTFTQDQIPLLEFTNYTCNKCHSKVISESIAENIQKELKQIENNDLLPETDINIIMELASQDKPLIAREIAEELDISSQSIGQKNKMLDLKKGLIKRNKDVNPFSYELTELAKNMYK